MRRYAVVFAVLGLCGTARADIIVPGANGSDGAFNPTATTTVDLALAPTGAWDSNSPTSGNGVYDPQKWAVVFHYTSVNIPAGVNIDFKNHVSQAPVVWLVSGSANIAGTISVSNDAADYQFPGPGGYRGMISGYAAAFGPGGCTASGGYGAYANNPTPPNSGKAYGNARIVPLIGGSGGVWAYGYSSHSPGGGAILIAAAGGITMDGTIKSVPYSSYGSGGAIRLVADSIAGSGALTADGTMGNNGRIRLEGNSIDTALRATPVASGGRPGTTATLWPAADAPSTRIVSVGGEAMPADPHAQLNSGADVFPDPLVATMPVVIETRNVPTTATVNLRIVSPGVDAQMIKAVFTSGDANTALWTAEISPPAGTSALQVRVEAP